VSLALEKQLNMTFNSPLKKKRQRALFIKNMY